MFAIDAGQEELFKKGWPHLRILVSPHPHEKDAASWAKKALEAYDPDVYHVEWPREVAYRFVRAMGAARAKDPRQDIDFPDEADVERRLAVAGPVDDKEARAIVAHVTHHRSVHNERAIEDLLYLLEAMVGGEPIVDAVLTRYEQMSDQELDWRNPHDVVNVAYWLGFVLHRLPDAAAKRHRARIEKLIQTKKPGSVRERFLMLLGGKKGLEETGWALGIHIAHYVNDPAFLVKYAGTGGGELDMQIAYQGGEKVLDVFAKRLRKVSAWRLPFLVDELAQVASPKATAMLKELGKRAAIKKKVEAVLASRSGKKPPKEKKPAAPKSRKSLEAAAEKRFDELSAWLAKELDKVRGNRKKEKALLEEAASRYAEIRTDLGEDPTEAVVHFFAADGCGYGKHREPPLLRIDPTDAELKRWVDLLSD